MNDTTRGDNGNRRLIRPRPTIQRGTAAPLPTPLDLVEGKLKTHVVFPNTA